MARRIAITFTVACAVPVLWGAQGCSGSIAGQGAADGSVSSPDAQGGVTTQTAACTAVGGQCIVDNGNCAARLLVDCAPGTICCVQLTTCTDANIQLIQASNYDQSCMTDSDCIGVGEGNACYPCAIECASAAINKSAESQYRADVAKTPAADAGPFCGCPFYFGPCCLDGQCRMGSQCPSNALCCPGGVCKPCSGDAGADTSTDAPADSCTPSGCTASCASNGGTHNVSTVVNGCTVWQCCVPDDAGADASGE